MQDIIQLHEEAMEFVDEAMILSLQGNSERARDINKQAFLKEKQAAELMANSYEIEPTRSVLCRSAATLALRCGEIAEVKRLVKLGLSGNPPTEIADELYDLLEQVQITQEEIEKFRRNGLSPDVLARKIVKKSK